MSMRVEEVFQPKRKKGRFTKEWEELEKSQDPLIEYWEEQKRRKSLCSFEKPKSTS